MLDRQASESRAGPASIPESARFFFDFAISRSAGAFPTASVSIREELP
jgi:hypothetical protein